MVLLFAILLSFSVLLRNLLLILSRFLILILSFIGLVLLILCLVSLLLRCQPCLQRLPFWMSLITEVFLLRNKYARVPDDFSVFKSPVGDLFHEVLSPSFRPDGTIELSVSDRIDIKKEINSHRDETDMSYILSRLMAGDDSVLNPNPPMYGDFTQFPKSYVEMLNLVLDGERYFNSLPIETRNKFDNDRGKWFASIGTESWFSAMGLVRREDQAVASVVPDVKLEKEVIE